LNVGNDAVMTKEGKSFPTIPFSKAKMSVVLEFAPILWRKCLPCEFGEGMHLQ